MSEPADQRSRRLPPHDPGVRLWPTIATTFMVGMGFAALKFVLIGRLIDWDPDVPAMLDAVPWDWAKHMLLEADHHEVLREAITQTMGAILTLGVLLGFVVNAPLAGAWRCDRLFAVSCAVVGVGCLATIWFNPWAWALIIGIAYGAACAARGKVVPLLAHATGRSNTGVSGGTNAALAIGLLAGTLSGSAISQYVGSYALQHVLLVVIAGSATAVSLLVQVPEPQKRPFAQGLRELGTTTRLLFQRHWPLLVGGGLAWGIASAASLAILIDAIDRLGLTRTHASTLVVFAGAGAILGNIVSPWCSRRRWVIVQLLTWALCILLYPVLVHGFWSAALAVTLVGGLFAAPANVLDARFLANAYDDGHAGLGGTTMSMVHSLFIFIIGTGLAIPLFLRAMRADTQFLILAILAALTVGVAWFAKLRHRVSE